MNQNADFFTIIRVTAATGWNENEPRWYEPGHKYQMSDTVFKKKAKIEKRKSKLERDGFRIVFFFSIAQVSCAGHQHVGQLDLRQRSLPVIRAGLRGETQERWRPFLAFLEALPAAALCAIY